VIRRLAGILLAIALLGLALSATAGAAITVANQNDSGPGSLREAVATSTPGETIMVPAGTYTLAGEPLKIEQKSLTIIGASEAGTVIRGNGASKVLFVIGPGEVNLQNLTVTEGRGSDAGAGIFAANADLKLEHVAVVHNTIDADGASGEPGGSATGAGVFFSGYTLEIYDSNISENTISADGGSGKGGGSATGGGLFGTTTGGGPLRVARTTFSGNTTSARGGQGPSSSEQTGGSVAGGGVFLTTGGGSTERFTGNTISGSSADVSGGPGGKNGSIAGGGLFAVAGAGPAVFADSTIANNVARGLAPEGSAVGGGVYFSAGPPLSILDMTVAANRIEGAIAASSIGGNAFLAGSIQVKNSIFADGAGPAANSNCYTSGPVESRGFNIDSTDQCGFHSAGDKVNTEPLLGPLQDNGGPTQTMAPLPISPAVDQGSAVAPTDQRGVGRPIDFPSIANAPASDGSDIGAVELQPASSLSLGKPKLNKKKGQASVAVTIPTPSAGTVALTGKGLKKQTASLTGQGSLTLKIVPTGGVARGLRRKGKARVSCEVIYSPTGNAAASKTAGVKLVQKIKKTKRSKGKGH
jgi:hypothetical protein